MEAEGRGAGELGLELDVKKIIIWRRICQRGDTAMVEAVDGVALATGEGRGISVWR